MKLDYDPYDNRYLMRCTQKTSNAKRTKTMHHIHMYSDVILVLDKTIIMAG